MLPGSMKVKAKSSLQRTASLASSLETPESHLSLDFAELPGTPPEHQNGERDKRPSNFGAIKDKAMMDEAPPLLSVQDGLRKSIVAPEYANAARRSVTTALPATINKPFEGTWVKINSATKAELKAQAPIFEDRRVLTELSESVLQSLNGVYTYMHQALGRERARHSSDVSLIIRKVERDLSETFKTVHNTYGVLTEQLTGLAKEVDISRKQIRSIQNMYKEAKDRAEAQAQYVSELETVLNGQGEGLSDVFRRLNASDVASKQELGRSRERAKKLERQYEEENIRLKAEIRRLEMKDKAQTVGTGIDPPPLPEMSPSWTRLSKKDASEDSPDGPATTHSGFSSPSLPPSESLKGPRQFQKGPPHTNVVSGVLSTCNTARNASRAKYMMPPIGSPRKAALPPMNTETSKSSQAENLVNGKIKAELESTQTRLVDLEHEKVELLQDVEEWKSRALVAEESGKRHFHLLKFSYGSLSLLRQIFEELRLKWHFKTAEGPGGGSGDIPETFQHSMSAKHPSDSYHRARSGKRMQSLLNQNDMSESNQLSRHQRRQPSGGQEADTIRIRSPERSLTAGSPDDMQDEEHKLLEEANSKNENLVRSYAVRGSLIRKSTEQKSLEEADGKKEDGVKPVPRASLARAQSIHGEGVVSRVSTQKSYRHDVERQGNEAPVVLPRWVVEELLQDRKLPPMLRDHLVIAVTRPAQEAQEVLDHIASLFCSAIPKLGNFSELIQTVKAEVDQNAPTEMESQSPERDAGDSEEEIVRPRKVSMRTGKPLNAEPITSSLAAGGRVLLKKLSLPHNAVGNVPNRLSRSSFFGSTTLTDQILDAQCDVIDENTSLAVTDQEQAYERQLTGGDDSDGLEADSGEDV